MAERVVGRRRGRGVVLRLLPAQPPPAGEQRVDLPPRPAVIGSHPSCDVVLDGLRPRHAVLARDPDGELVVRAIAGTTYVDGTPVVAQRVGCDSEIRAGRYRLQVQPEPAQVWCT